VVTPAREQSQRSTVRVGLAGPERWVQAHPLLVDAGLAVLVLAVSLAGLYDGGRGGHRGPGGPGGASGPGAVVDMWAVGLLLAAAAALVTRRRLPLPVWALTLAAAFGVVLLGGDDPAVSAPLLLALYTVGKLRPWGVALATVVASGTVYTIALALVQGALLDDRGDLPALTVVALGGAAAAVGIAVRGQRTALEAARARARQAEATREEEAQRRVTDERLRIARDLHDVVAHHISVVNVQSGVARHLMDTHPEQARTALGLVRDASKTVLTELSAVLGLLRAEDGTSPAEPAPGLSRLPSLVESVRGAGLDLELQCTGQSYELAPVNDLTAYRVVQESLTNALKYGSGRARLLVDHAPEGVTIDVVNPLAPDRPATSGGHGLIGMRERLDGVHGWLTAGPDGAGSWVLRAGIPRGQA
jgi:signal transduction histidine kinase